MVSLNQVEEQLKRVGCNFRFWGRPEIRELCNILMQGETITQCVNGRYEGGFALLVATDHRLLLIDKKPMFLTLEDIRYDMVSEMDYSAQLLGATVHIITPNRKLSFTAWNQARLRKMMNHIQQRVMEVRQHYMMQQLQHAQELQQTHATTVGGLALQGNARQGGYGYQSMPLNPYTKMSLLMRRRRVPRFY